VAWLHFKENPVALNRESFRDFSTGNIFGSTCVFKVYYQI